MCPVLKNESKIKGQGVLEHTLSFYCISNISMVNSIRMMISPLR